MIKMAVAAALAAIVVADGAFVPASTGAGVTTERPRGLKGDRLPVLVPNQVPSQIPSNAACANATWPHYPAECIRTPSTRLVRTV
jgi:hypothetical protein